MRGITRQLARSIIRIAARRAPVGRRERMVREWDAELEREFAAGGGWGSVWNATGSFADAGALRDVDATSREAGTMTRVTATLRNDVRHAIRTLLRAPGFTAVAVFTLAIGIGGSASIYTLLDRIVIDPLPFPEPEELVLLENQVPGISWAAVWALSTAQYIHYREHATTLAEIGLFRTAGGNVSIASGAVRARSVQITASTARMLGLRAYTGRPLDASDERLDGPQVVAISHEFWTRALGSDPDVVGSALLFDDVPFEVVGVHEPGTSLPGVATSRAPDLWMPMRIDPEGRFSNNHVFPGLGRIAPGSTPEAVEMELDRLEAQLPDAFPSAYGTSFLESSGFRTTATPLKTSILGDLASQLWLLFAGVGLVLLIASANVANLFLVRMDGKRQELAVRRALGAGRSDLGRYVLTEGLTLAAAGGVLSVVVGIWAVPAMARLAPFELPQVQELQMSIGTLGFSLLLSILVGLAIAAYPALGPTADQGASGLAGSNRGSSGTRARQHVRSALVVAQMAFAVALLVGAGMLVDGLQALRGTDPGFQTEDAYALDLHASGGRYPDNVALWSFHRDVLAAVAQLPGVEAVGMGDEIPVSGGFGCTVQAFEDDSVLDHLNAVGLTTCAGQTRVTPGYFDALGIPLLEGRAIEEADYDDPSRGAVVVSKAFAEQFWPGESPIGKGVGPNGRSEPPYYRVVGVVDDVKKRASQGQPPLAETAIAIYYPGVDIPRANAGWRPWWPRSTTLVVRMNGTEAGDPTAAIRQAVQEIDPETPIANARALEDIVASPLASLSFLTLLMAIAAGVALGLATLGLYGVVSYVVSQRRKEIGMRLAIGAAPAEVVQTIVMSTARLVVAGLVVGIPLAILTTRVGQSFLVEIEATEPIAYLGAALAVGLVSVTAAWLPARRAASIDPVESLRAE